jgi:alpha-D-ribose 1-methylphosphonate 5-triphosphate synthase subunit PhnH
MSTILESKSNQYLTTQDTFRVLMDCLARPGKINWLADQGLTPPPGLYAYSALILVTLLDGEIPFATLTGNESWNEYIRLNTGAPLGDVAEAEIILADGRLDIPAIADVNRGELLAPEKGATLIFQVDRIEESPICGYTGVTLQGPGVNFVRDIYLSGMALSHWPRLRHLNREYPLGVDLFLVAADGRVAGIPRSNRFSWEVIG